MEIRIDIPQFDLHAQRVLEQHASYWILMEDRIEHYLKTVVETPKDEDDNKGEWVVQRWLTKGFLLKDAIRGINMFTWDTYPEHPSCTLTVEASGHQDLKATFKTISECSTAYKIVYDWFFNKKPPTFQPEENQNEKSPELE